MARIAVDSGLLAGATAAGAQLAGFVVGPLLLTQLGMSFAGAYTACVLATVGTTLALGLAGQPLLAMTPLAITGWLVYACGISSGLSWQQLLGVTAAVSLVGGILSIAAARSHVVRTNIAALLPEPLRWGLKGGLGLLLVVLGLTQGRLLVAAPWAGSASPMMLGDMADPLAYLSLVGIIVTLALLFLRVPRALCLLSGMVITALVAFGEGFWALPEAPGFLPEGLDAVALQLTLAPERDGDCLRLLGTGLTLLLALLSLNEGVLAASRESAAGHRPRVCVWAGSLVAACAGALPLALSPLSVVMQRAGGQRGRSALAAAVVLGLAFFLEPVLQAMADFPAMAVPVLVVGGLLILEPVLAAAGDVLASHSAGLSALLTLLLIPLAGDLATGLGTGILTYAGGEILAGRGRAVGWPLYGLAFVFLVYFLLLAY